MKSGLSEGTRLVQQAADFVQNIAFETVPITLGFFTALIGESEHQLRARARQRFEYCECRSR